MKHNYLSFIALATLLIVIVPAYGMEKPFSLSTFEEQVNTIKKSCKKNILTNQTKHAMLAITDNSPLNITQNTENAAYKTFQNLDLSFIMKQLNEDKTLQEKPWQDPHYPEKNIIKITVFARIQLSLAQHNMSVTYMPGQERIFSQEPVQIPSDLYKISDLNATAWRPLIHNYTDEIRDIRARTYAILDILCQQEEQLFLNTRFNKIQHQCAHSAKKPSDNKILITDLPISTTAENTQPPKTFNSKTTLSFSQKLFIGGTTLTLLATLIYFIYHYQSANTVFA